MTNKTYILGPCSIETEDLFNEIGSSLVPIMEGKDWIYKASFDKANRSSIDGKRGPGIDESIKIFKNFKKKYPNVRLTTDVHEVWQVEKLSEVIDIIQIPAFLCRQTDLLVECAKHFNVVNIKKGQWMSPQNMAKGVDKIKNTNPNCEAWVTERGTQFGYGQLIVDFAAVDVLNKVYDKVILDCTHSTQRLKPNGRTGGSGEMAVKYFKVSDTFGYDGVFAECHPNPPMAYSDADCQIQLDDMVNLLKKEK
jgi:2-dehydro-3-deoxyphosphooctonate aldolase (KDO 8-P synthase)|tara:strand:+ start:474 stop:1226 length:753 start_codon:yes stop_codon:yes gene_type:complete